jgi:hypothetical protein
MIPPLLFSAVAAAGRLIYDNKYEIVTFPHRLNYLTIKTLTLSCTAGAPHSRFHELPSPEQQRIRNDEDRFVNACVSREKGTWFKFDSVVEMDCKESFWDKFNEKFKKNGFNSYSIKVEYGKVEPEEKSK